MATTLGLIGLPNAGKSTLFNALTTAGAAVAAYPFTTIEPNVGVVQVPDKRLDDLAEIVRPEKIVPTTMEFVDIAGLVKGSSHGEGLGNQFLGHIRNVDAVAFVLRCFTDQDVPHVYGEVDALRDAEILASELCLADMATLERRLEKTRQAAKSGDKRFLKQIDIIERWIEHLDRGEPVRSFVLTQEEADLVADAGMFNGLLTNKPALYVANVAEDDLAEATDIAACKEGYGPVADLKRMAEREGSGVVAVSAKLESELAELPPEEAAEYRASIGVAEAGLDRLIVASYRLLGLITFFTTTGEKEVRAWTVTKGTKAPEAAGKVHSEMEKGFIRAEVVSYVDLIKAGSFASVRERGLMRLEGREYEVQDGDIIHFRFNV